MPVIRGLSMLLLKMIAAIDTWTGFDRWGPDANPLIRQARRRTGWLSLRAILWLAFFLGIGGTLFATTITLSGTDDNFGDAEWLLFLGGWALTLIAPIITASLSMWLTHRAVHAEAYEITRMTPLPNKTLVRAHVFMALYRVRYLLAALGALMPFMVIETYHFLIVIQAGLHSYTPEPPTYWEGVWPTLICLLIILGLWGFTLLGAATGVRAAILRRNSGVAGLVVLVQMSMAALCPCACCWIGTALVTDYASGIGPLILFLGLLAWTIMPYGFAQLALADTVLVWRR